MFSPAFLDALARTPSADNSQPWRFSEADGRFACAYRVRHGHVDPFGPTGHASLIAGGAMHESMAGVAGRDADRSGIATAIDPTGWTVTLHAPASEAAGIAGLLGRHTNRHPYLRATVDWSVPARPWPRGTRISLLAAADRIALVAQAVRLTSAVRFNTRELHEWLFCSIRWSADEVARGDGLDVASLHLPPGGRQFMAFIAPWKRMATLNQLGLYRVMAAIDARLVADAPAIVALTGGNAPDQIWEAGRAMMEAWVSLNGAGYAVHPYYVVTDISNRLGRGRVAPEWTNDSLRALSLVHEAVGMQRDEQVHLLLRVGKPSRPPVRSRRLPIDQLLSHT